MAFLKIEPPAAGARETDAERLARLGDYIEQHGQELDYVLTHLSGKNMNGNLFSVDVKDASGESLGTIGWTGSGIGAVIGGASIEARQGGVYMMYGGAGLRITAAGPEKTADGITWESL